MLRSTNTETNPHKDNRSKLKRQLSAKTKKFAAHSKITRQSSVVETKMRQIATFYYQKSQYIR